MTLIEILIVLSLLGTVYSYFIYPVILLCLPRKNRIPQHASPLSENELPFLSIIITAYNEEQRLEAKIKNTLSIDYPQHKREILIASDGSTDRTNAIAESFATEGVKLIRVTVRKGKENAQLAAIQAAAANILIFSDVATEISPEALKIIAHTFSDEKIGAVSSEDRFVSEDGKIAGEGAYVKYEMWLRKLEAEVKSLIGLSGSFFACRKSICDNWDITVPSDFNTALNCVAQGYIAISHPQVLGYYPSLKDESKEYSRKLRTVIRGMAALASKPFVLNPFKYGLFAFQVFSHKLMRWLVPWFMLTLFISNLLAVHIHAIYVLLLLGQCIFYGLAIIGWQSSSARNHGLFKIPYFFMQVNLAISHAGALFINGKRITKWEPSKR